MDFEDAHGGPEKLEALFNKCLLALPTVPLWSFYLSYIRKAHSPPAVGPDRVSAGRSTILEAYEFALQNVGMDKDSGTLWMDYLSFIKSGDVGPLHL